ncbi:hypothetical protein C7R93_19670 [Brevibacillus fortis]|uniref:Uncharacterized protein n=1 Tax=Brevibacillus fortis TaxID=2126352 RepID=A0A2P7V0G0_9BACL|nr:hypothetical protein C7R93_19670 [Brevibacillus fortis]
MFSSRLYPLFVRAVSFQTCDSTSVQLWLFTSFISTIQKNPPQIEEDYPYYASFGNTIPRYS